MDERAHTEGPRGGRVTVRLVVGALLYLALLAYLVYVYLGLRASSGIAASIFLAPLAAIAVPIGDVLPSQSLGWLDDQAVDHPHAFLIVRAVLALVAWALVARSVAAAIAPPR